MCQFGARSCQKNNGVVHKCEGLDIRAEICEEKNEAIVCRRDKFVELGEDYDDDDDDKVRRNKKCVIQELSVHQLLTGKTTKTQRSRYRRNESSESV